jgi:hypothetical protein
MPDESVGQLAELYLGNILYGMELAALGLEAQGRRDDAAFYRGIARKLAEAHGKGRDAGGHPPKAGGGARGAGDSPASGAPSGAY